MANQFIHAHLRNLPLLARVPPTQLDHVANAVEVLQLQPNMLVFRQGQPAQGLYLMVDGHAVLFSGTSGSERMLGEVNANQYVGEAALFQNGTERMTMRVTAPSVLLFLSRLKFHQLLLEHPELRQHITSQYAHLNVQTDSEEAFAGQRPGEALLLFQRRHPWAFARNSILPLLIGLLLIAIAFILGQTGLTLPMLVLAIIVPGAWIYYAYIEWQNDYLIITDQRVIHHQRTILALTNSIHEVLISSVQEVNFHIPAADFFARMFNFGTIFIRTPGETGNLELTLMPNPKRIQEVLINDLKVHKEVAEQQDRAAIGAAIDEILKPDGGGQYETEASEGETGVRKRAVEPGGLFSTRYVDGNGDIIYRKHLSVWMGHVLSPSLMMIAGGVVFIIAFLGPDPLRGLEVLAGMFLVLVGAAWFYLSDWDWRNDMLIISDSTARLIHRRPLWLEDISEQVLLARVDDVTVIRNGLLNTLLNRGDLRISLIGDDTPKEFNSVGSPEHVKNQVFERRAGLQLRQQEQELSQQRQEIARYLDVYHERMRAMYPNPPYAQQNQPPSAGYPPPTMPPQSPQSPQPSQEPPMPPPPPPPGRQGPRPPRIPRTRDDQSS